MLRSNLTLLSLALVIWLFPQKSFALSPDSSSYVKIYEDSLKQLQYGRIDKHKSDAQKEVVNAHFRAMLLKALNMPGSFDYAFDSLTSIGRVVSPDKKFRIINWNLPKEDGSQEYFGFMQSYNSKTKKYVVYSLTDKSNDIKDPQTKTCTADQWLGMLYYKIVVEKAGKKPLYTLLAWKGYSKQITQKIIDVVSFGNDGSPSFGKSVFTNLPASFKGSPKRLIFQYSSSASMVLDFNPKKEIIQFDHLGPREDGLDGQYQFYGPSFQIDGLVYKDDKWSFTENVDARNANDGKGQYNDPEKNDNQVNKKPIYTPPH